MNEKLMQEVIAKAIAAHGNQENKLLEMLLNPVVIAALFAGVATVIAAMARAASPRSSANHPSSYAQSLCKPECQAGIAAQVWENT